MTGKRQPTQAQQEQVYLPFTGEIDGRTYRAIGNKTYVRPLPPGVAPSRNANAVTSQRHRGKGWRLEWIFLIIPLVFGLGSCGIVCQLVRMSA